MFRYLFKKDLKIDHKDVSQQLQLENSKLINEKDILAKEVSTLTKWLNSREERINKLEEELSKANELHNNILEHYIDINKGNKI